MSDVELIKHNWMYSFLPASIPSSISTTLIQDELYLVGFCSNCRKAVSVLIGRDFKSGKSRITDTDIPRGGCEYKNE